MMPTLGISQPYIVIQTTQAPYSTSTSVDSLEAALAATNIGLTVVYMFMHNGVFQLLAEQQNTKISHKSIFKKLTALPLFDVELIFAQASAMQTHNIAQSKDKHINAVLIEDNEIAQICSRAQQVLVF